MKTSQNSNTSAAVRVAVISGCVLIFAVAILPLILRPFHRLDVEIFLRAVKATFDGQPIYFLTSAGGEHTKPPFATLLFVPFSFLPTAWFVSFWDLLNVLALPYVLWWSYVQLPDSLKLKNRSAFLIPFVAVFFVLGPWATELSYGQYNLVSLALLLFAATRSCGWQAVAMVMSVLLKPTNIIFLPWMYTRSKNPRVLTSAMAIFSVLLAVIYAGLFGFTALVEHHKQYLAFGPQTHAANILKDENFGLARILVSLFPPLFKVSAYFFLLGFGIAAGLAFKFQRSWILLPLTCLVVLLTSPMVWFKNFVLMGPCVVALLCFAFGVADRRQKKIALLGLVALYVTTQLYNPTFLGRTHFDELRVFAFPLWGSLVATFALLTNFSKLKKRLSL